MSDEDTLIDQVAKLVEAENSGGISGAGAAEAILSKEFTAITRSSHVEQDRARLVESIRKGPGDRLRTLDRGQLSVWVDGDVGVVRSLVTVCHGPPPQNFLGTFRNVHVFRREPTDDKTTWQCVAWQVTGPLIEPPPA